MDEPCNVREVEELAGGSDGRCCCWAAIKGMWDVKRVAAAPGAKTTMTYWFVPTAGAVRR